MKFRWRRIVYYASVVIKLWWASENKLGWREWWRRDKRKIKLAGKSLWFDTYRDLLEIKEVVLDREYEKNGAKIRKSDTLVVDIGGGVGDYAILSAMENPGVVVISFEPDKTRYGLMKKNMRENGVINLKVVRGRVDSINDVFKIIGGKTINVLKIDCEGCEYQIVGKTRKKEWQRVERVIMEYHESESLKKEQLTDKLEGGGFRVDCWPRSQVPGLGLLLATKQSF